MRYFKVDFDDGTAAWMTLLDIAKKTGLSVVEVGARFLSVPHLDIQEKSATITSAVRYFKVLGKQTFIETPLGEEIKYNITFLSICNGEMKTMDADKTTYDRSLVGEVIACDFENETCYSVSS